jgi:hypothetical protein
MDSFHKAKEENEKMWNRIGYKSLYTRSMNLKIYQSLKELMTSNIRDLLKYLSIENGS